MNGHLQCHYNCTRSLAHGQFLCKCFVRRIHNKVPLWKCLPVTGPADRQLFSTVAAQYNHLTGPIIRRRLPWLNYLLLSLICYVVSLYHDEVSLVRQRWLTTLLWYCWFSHQTCTTTISEMTYHLCNVKNRIKQSACLYEVEQKYLNPMVISTAVKNRQMTIVVLGPAGLYLPSNHTNGALQIHTVLYKYHSTHI